VAPQFGEYDDNRLGRVAPQFGDMEGIWGSHPGAAKKVGGRSSKVAKTTVKYSEKAGVMPFKALNKVAQSGVRLVSGIGKRPASSEAPSSPRRPRSPSRRRRA